MDLDAPIKAIRELEEESDDVDFALQSEDAQMIMSKMLWKIISIPNLDVLDLSSVTAPML